MVSPATSSLIRALRIRRRNARHLPLAGDLSVGCRPRKYLDVFLLFSALVFVDQPDLLVNMDVRHGAVIRYSDYRRRYVVPFEEGRGIEEQAAER